MNDSTRKPGKSGPREANLHVLGHEIFDVSDELSGENLYYALDTAKG